MKHHRNTLYVSTQGSYLAKESETVLVKRDGEVRAQFPFLALESIVCLGQVTMSPVLMSAAAEAGIAVCFLSEHGRYLARVVGPTTGNVLLRREQYRRADDSERSARLAVAVVSAKVANARTVLLRGARDRPDSEGATRLRAAARAIAELLSPLCATADLDEVRGIEGACARLYFGVFDDLITQQKESFFFRERTRRPPQDNINAMLSFVYTLLVHDVRGALESVGLDPQVGFLHRDRPGRPGLALDLVEELRPWLADRLVLSLVNLRQLGPTDFRSNETGGVVMTDDARKALLVAYQKRKQEEIVHPFLEERTTVGLVPHLQAQLLARHLRGDHDAYPPFIWK